MRISDSYVYSSLNKNLSRTKADLAAAQEKASSGKRVGKPSDTTGTARKLSSWARKPVVVALARLFDTVACCSIVCRAPVIAV